MTATSIAIKTALPHILRPPAHLLRSRA